MFVEHYLLYEDTLTCNTELYKLSYNKCKCKYLNQVIFDLGNMPSFQVHYQVILNGI